MQWAIIGGAGAGVVAIVTGVGLSLAKRSREEDYEEDEGFEEDDRYDDDRDDRYEDDRYDDDRDAPLVTTVQQPTELHSPHRRPPATQRLDEAWDEDVTPDESDLSFDDLPEEKSTDRQPSFWRRWLGGGARDESRSGGEMPRQEELPSEEDDRWLEDRDDRSPKDAPELAPPEPRPIPKFPIPASGLTSSPAALPPRRPSEVPSPPADRYRRRGETATPTPKATPAPKTSKAAKPDRRSTRDRRSPAPSSDRPTLSPTRIVPPNPVDLLLQGLRSDSAATRRKAIWELGQRGDSQSIQPLVEAMLDGDSKQRSLVLAALSEIGMRSLKPALKVMSLALQDNNPDVRTNAIRDLSQIYDQMVQLSRMLAFAAQDEDATVQKTATWAMKKLDTIRNASAHLSESSSSLSPSAARELRHLLADHEDSQRAIAEGLALLEAGQTTEAVDSLETLSQSAPADPQARAALAQALAAQGNPASALAVALEARDLFASRGDLEAARQIEAQLAEQGVSPEAAAFHAASGALLFREGNFDKAAEELERSIALNPHNPEAHLTLARIRRGQHRVSEAIACLSRARDLCLELGNGRQADNLQELIQQMR